MSSATGNPRNKVCLKPGHSLMDWIRLGNSGKDLAGTGGKILSVSKSELAKHNNKNDAWLSIRGNVYNVTSYMDFHPGGPEELMRGVGTDATKLFNEVHAWVNYQSILQKCLVGHLKMLAGEDIDITATSASFLPPERPAPHQSKNKEIVSKEKSQLESLKMDWFQQIGSLCMVFYTKTINPVVHVLLEEENLLCVKVNAKVQRMRLEAAVNWPCNVTVDSSGKVQIRLTKRSPGLWSRYGKLEPFTADISEYWEVVVANKTKLTHNTYQMDLAFKENVFNYTPVGHHVLVKASINGERVIRPYTPVTSLAGLCIPPTGCVRFIIKEYPSGSMSPWLVAQPIGTKLQVSLPTGSFSLLPLGIAKYLVLLAAGTGLTPMISLISWALRSSKMNVKLVFFNKSEVDIMWEEQFEKLSSDNPRFSVDHILSESSSSWTGKTGHISQSLLQSYLPIVSNDIPNIHYVCVCGPKVFTQLAERCLKEDFGFTKTNYYCFLG